MLLPANLQGGVLEPERGSQNPRAGHKQSRDLGTGDQRFPGPHSSWLLHFCILPFPSSLCFSSFLHMWVGHGCPSLSVKSLPISRSQREFWVSSGPGSKFKERRCNRPILVEVGRGGMSNEGPTNWRRQIPFSLSPPGWAAKGSLSRPVVGSVRRGEAVRGDACLRKCTLSPHHSRREVTLKGARSGPGCPGTLHRGGPLTTPFTDVRTCRL